MRKSLMVLLLTRGGASALQALTLIIVARNTTLAEFATLGTTQGVLLTYYAFADLGVSAFLLRARARGSSSDVDLALTLNQISTLVSTAIVIFPIVLLVNGRQRNNLIALCLLAVAFGLEKSTDTLLSVPIADGRSSIAATSILIRRGLGILITVAFLSIGLPPLISYASGYLLGCVAAQFQIRSYLISHTRVERQRQRWRDAMSLTKTTWPFMLYFVAGQARALDVGIVSLASGSSAAGIYSAAVRLTSPLQQIPTALSQLVIPRATIRGASYSWQLGRRLSWISLGLATATLPFVFLGDKIMLLVLGDQYGNSGLALFWSVQAMIYISLTGPLSSLLQANDGERSAGIIAVLGTLLALVSAGVGGLLHSFEGALSALSLISALRCIILLVRLRARTRT